jgi:hypothetical protein
MGGPGRSQAAREPGTKGAREWGADEARHRRCCKCSQWIGSKKALAANFAISLLFIKSS